MNTTESSQINIEISRANSGMDFVGLRLHKDKHEVVFPMGYDLSSFPDNKSICLDEVSQYQDLLENLIDTITDCTDSFQDGELISSIGENKKNTPFPIQAMKWLIFDFLERHAYYIEKEVIYRNGKSGKISWNKTVKHIKPVISGKNIVFLDFIVRKNPIKENQIITELHKYCVKKSFELLGWIWSSDKPDDSWITEEDISDRKEEFVSIIREKQQNTYNDHNIELFDAMIKVIEEFDIDSQENEYLYGTKHYNVVWEKMIDNIFGTEKGSDKEKYYPWTKWNTKNAGLRPDTILCWKDECFILDAKYYSYEAKTNFDDIDEDKEAIGMDSRQKGSIPGSDSIQKQITYAQFIDSDCQLKDGQEKISYSWNKIFNAFILPKCHAYGESLFMPIEGKVATAGWNRREDYKAYRHIVAITMDTKDVMENSVSSNYKKENLISIVKNIALEEARKYSKVYSDGYALVADDFDKIDVNTTPDKNVTYKRSHL